MAALSLTRSELEELDHFLLSGKSSSRIVALDTLHGFLTAIAVAPVDTPSQRWIAYICRTSSSEGGNCSDADFPARIVAYLQRLLDDIRAAVDGQEFFFSPLVMTRSFRGRQYADGEMWCYGFLQGVALNQGAWASFLASAAGEAILRPIRLLASDQIAPETEGLVSTPRQRARLTSAIPVAVKTISDHFFEIELAKLSAYERNSKDATVEWLH